MTDDLVVHAAVHVVIYDDERVRGEKKRKILSSPAESPIEVGHLRKYVLEQARETALDALAAAGIPPRADELLEHAFAEGGPRRDPTRTVGREAELAERYMPGHPVTERLLAAAREDPDRLLSDFYRERGLLVFEDAPDA